MMKKNKIHHLGLIGIVRQGVMAKNIYKSLKRTYGRSAYLCMACDS